MESSLPTMVPGGVPIAYRDRNPAARSRTTPVVLVHGLGGDGRTWDRFGRQLARAGRRVVTVDLRGHGRSGRAPSYLFDDFATDLVGVCDHLGLDRIDLVGHSLGGHVGSRVALRYPNRVRRLVLEETPLPLRPGDPTPDIPAHRPTPAELWHATSSMVRNPRAVLAFDRSMTESVVTQFHTPNPQWWQQLPNLTAPTLFLRGQRRGSLVDRNLLDDALALLPSASVRGIACGHSIHRDRSRDFAAAALPFLADPADR